MKFKNKGEKVFFDMLVVIKDFSAFMDNYFTDSNNINSYTSSIYDEYKKYSEKLVKIIKSCDNNERQ